MKISVAKSSVLWDLGILFQCRHFGTAGSLKTLMWKWKFIYMFTSNYKQLQEEIDEEHSPDVNIKTSFQWYGHVTFKTDLSQKSHYPFFQALLVGWQALTIDGGLK